MSGNKVIIKCQNRLKDTNQINQIETVSRNGGRGDRRRKAFPFGMGPLIIFSSHQRNPLHTATTWHWRNFFSAFLTNPKLTHALHNYFSTVTRKQFLLQLPMCILIFPSLDLAGKARNQDISLQQMEAFRNRRTSLQLCFRKGLVALFLEWLQKKSGWEDSFACSWAKRRFKPWYTFKKFKISLN